MSIFCDLLRCLLCCEDEHDNDYHSPNQFPAKTASNKHDYYYEPSHRNPLQPLTSFTPAASSLKPPPTRYNQVLSPFSPSSLSPKPPSSLSKPPQVSSINTSSSSPKSRVSCSVDSHSTSLKTPTSSAKLPQSTFVNSSSPLSPFSPSSLSPKPPSSLSKPPQVSSINTSSSSPKSQVSCSVDSYSTSLKTPTSSAKLPQSTFVNSSSPLKPPTSSFKPSQSYSSSSTRPSIRSSSSSTFYTKTSNIVSSSKPPQASSKPHSSSPKPPTSSSKPSSFSSGPPVSSSKLPPVFKPVLCPASSNVINQKGKNNYVWVENDSLPIFTIPEDIKDLIKNDIVPKVLNQPLSPTTYKDYFAALLYAEEFYFEKWAHFHLEKVTLELHEAKICKNGEKEQKTFVAFEIDSVPENRPFLLSRDLVYVRPSGTNFEKLQGFIYRIVKSNRVLVEFGGNFYVRHDSSKKYDVSFSFNRIGFKRAHQAVQTASDALFRNFVFPDGVSRKSIPTAPALLSTCNQLDPDQFSAVRHILSIKGSPPYLVAGRRARVVVSEAVSQICQTSLENRILICAPSNRCCDGVMSSLLKVISESDMFRANAAFREKYEVPDNILPSCLYEEGYFSCPPIEKLRKYRVIFSTFISSFRLHDKGLTVGHFSHIFLVDASSALEPETMVALTNFADKNTTVIVTGEPGNRSHWVRADIARKNGLRISYFERLLKSMPYRSLSPMFITRLEH